MKMLFKITIDGTERNHVVLIRFDPSNDRWYAYFEDFDTGQLVWRQWGYSAKDALDRLLAEVRKADPLAVMERMTPIAELQAMEATS